MTKKDLPKTKEKNSFWLGALVGLMGGVFGGLFANSVYDSLKNSFGTSLTTILSGLIFIAIVFWASKKITKVI